MLIKKHPHQAIDEEIVNVATHAIGVLLGIVALFLLVIHPEVHSNLKMMISVSIYSCTLIFSYLCSVLYHAVQYKPAKHFLHVLDHSGIYLLIAGTYTPFMIISIGGVVGWTMFCIIWGLALIGLIYKWFFMGRWPVFSTVLYLCMGWLAVVAIRPIIQHLPFAAILWIFAGGACYTLGVIFFSFDHKIKFFHALWHLFVLAGSICHFFAILFYVRV